MPASAARIGFILSEFRTAVASDPAIKTRYGAAARDTKADVIETFFDTEADTQAMADERLALLKADRRRFTVEIERVLSFTGTLAYNSVLPAVTLIDADKNANLAAAIVAVDSINYETNRTVLKVWG